MFIPENRMELLPIEMYLELYSRLQAFSTRDLQTAVTLFTWMDANAITMQELALYLFMMPAMDQVFRMGYFSSMPQTIDHLRHVKEFEKGLPKNLRRHLRRIRLRATETGRMPFDKP